MYYRRALKLQAFLDIASEKRKENFLSARIFFSLEHGTYTT